ncbi:MAG: hypothetical protein GY694_08640 [Gammaproteobacteria bacterium]|nr:hypothetical protein [Gammaproteobacteria bacterium]
MQNTLIKNMIALAVIGVLLGLIISNSYNSFNLLTYPPDLPRVTDDSKIIATNKNAVTPHTIVRWHLFGTRKMVQTVVPKSTLHIKLIGIISSTMDGEARVIIENNSRKQTYYKVGDKIKQNVTIKSIQPNHIVIMHNSRQEIIPLKNSNKKNTIIRKTAGQ